MARRFFEVAFLLTVMSYGEIRKGADTSLAFRISRISGLQHNQKNFSWMG
jgi:hypothetical protein